MPARTALLLVALVLAGVPWCVSRPHYDPSFGIHFRLPSFCNGTECKVLPDGTVQLTAAKNKMGAFESKSYFQYGVFEVNMKLPSGYSGGLIPCIYLISGENLDYRDVHDEMDFEFLGGSDPSSIRVHTNVIAGGYTNVEQYKFAFDPSAAFHTYTMVYAPNWLVWKIDGRPIRITWRESGKPFPSLPMKIMGSIWDASFWLPLKSDYSKGNVTVKFRRFNLREACRVENLKVEPACAFRNDARTGAWLTRPTRNDIARAKRHRTLYLFKEYGGWQKVV
ncbi:hypothetical protein CLOM_g3517 [Closterium sp. NIES-68]|nr:hypothetical protein CLOM_g3517 [Closterium sp. NIES-68]GJP75253.1 hypothetical protein CLOP_g5710 [Closterium sp. NIES-67]